MSDLIVKNSVKCNSCGEILVSSDPITVKKCKCGKTSISGGKQTLIREGSNFEELSTFLLIE